MKLMIRGQLKEDGSFDWKNAIADAGILSGITFFTMLVAFSATGILNNPKLSLLTAGISTGLEFFIILAGKRGLVQKGDN